jgi:hypothetical protein
MNEWNFDQRLQELERKALFKKITRDFLKKFIPGLFLALGSIGLVTELDGIGPKIAAGFLAAGTYLSLLVGLLE